VYGLCFVVCKSAVPASARPKSGYSRSVNRAFNLRARRRHHSVCCFLARLLLTASAVGLAAACGREATARDETGAAIDALFAEWNRSDSPGCGVGVMRGGAMLFERGYGMANLESKIPITTSTIFDPASIAKPFAALAIIILADQGKLSLDDEVWKHVPEWANRQDRITIRHLLAHSGGLRDVFLLIELAPPAAPGVDINEHILRTLARQRGVNFAPSTEFSYNNGGYNVLGSIVARLSGQSFREFAASHIFGPLGMTRSSFRGGVVTISRDHALGYHSDGDRFQLARDGGVDTSAIVGNSGLFTTVADVLRFAQNLGDARVGSRENLTAMQTPVSLGANGTSPYGLGLEVGDDGGLKTVGHGGGDRGIAAYLIRYPSHDLNVAVLCNMDNLNVDGRVRTLARQVAAAFLPARSKPVTNDAAAVPSGPAMSSAELTDKTGLYRDVSTDTYGRLYMRNGKLWASMDAGDGDGDSVELRPLDANRFSVPGTPVVAEFVPPANGRPRQIRVTGAGPKPFVSEQVVEGFAPTAAQLREYAGSYTNVDLDVTYTIVARPSGLVVQIPGRAEVPLTPVLPHAFYGSLVDLIKFSGAGGRPATGFTINRGTARNLRFERVR
jgi:CubicO group peptidase (beta-lactamase class C family)